MGMLSTSFYFSLVLAFPDRLPHILARIESKAMRRKLLRRRVVPAFQRVCRLPDNCVSRVVEILAILPVVDSATILSEMGSRARILYLSRITGSRFREGTGILKIAH